MYKIIVVTPWFPSKEQPHNGIFVMEQTKAIVCDDFQVTVLHYFGENSNSYFFTKSKITQKKKDGIFYIVKKGIHFPLRFIFTRFMWVKQYIKLINTYLIKFEKPDLIHAHTYWGGIIALHLKKKFGIPYIVTEHSSSIIKNKHIKPKRKRLISNVYDNSNYIIAVGATLANSMKKFTNKEIQIIPNSINTSFFKPSNSVANKQTQITIIGGLIPRKRTEIAVKVVNKLVLKGYDVSLNVIGQGPNYDNLLSLIKELNATKYIFLLGYKSRNEIKEILNSTDVYLHTSKFETFGIVMIEAMAMGLPVVTTNSFGPKSFITKENGIICNNDSLDTITESLLFILNNKDMYNSKKIRQYIIDNFSDEIISNKIKTIYTTIINNTNNQ